MLFATFVLIWTSEVSHYVFADYTFNKTDNAASYFADSLFINNKTNFSAEYNDTLDALVDPDGDEEVEPKADDIIAGDTFCERLLDMMLEAQKYYQETGSQNATLAEKSASGAFRILECIL